MPVQHMNYFKLYKRMHNGILRYVDKNEDPKVMRFLAHKLAKKAKERIKTSPRNYVPLFIVFKVSEEEVEKIR